MPKLHRALRQPVVSVLCAAACFCAAGPGRAADTPPLIGATRGGLPVVVFSAPDAPVCVVQLHVLLDDGTWTPEARAQLGPALDALAWGAVPGRVAIADDVRGQGGETQTRLLPGALVISDAAPPSALVGLLRAADARLRLFRALLPAEHAPAALAPVHAEVEADALALAWPGHPLALPLRTTDRAPPNAAVIHALLGQALLADRVAIVVVGNAPAADLLADTVRTFQARLPRAAPPVLFPPVTQPARVAAERADASGQARTRMLFFAAPPAVDPGAPPADPARVHAALAVAMDLAGGALEDARETPVGVLELRAPRMALLVQGEAQALARLTKLAGRAPAAAEMADAVARVRTAALARFTSPQALALAAGTSLLWFGRADAQLAAITALAQVSPDDISSAAARLAGGRQVSLRDGATP